MHARVKHDELTRLILRYLIHHPDACDTIEGITHWWVTREVIEVKIEEVSDVLTVLLRQDLVLKKTAVNSVVMYTINKAKLDEIKEIIANPLDR